MAVSPSAALQMAWGPHLELHHLAPLSTSQVRYLVEVPPEGADPKRSFKYPFTACEIFCCEVEGIFNTLLENEDVLAQLFSLLQVRRFGCAAMAFHACPNCCLLLASSKAPSITQGGRAALI